MVGSGRVRSGQVGSGRVSRVSSKRAWRVKSASAAGVGGRAATFFVPEVAAAMALVVGAAQLKARLTQKTACRPTEMTRRKMPNATVGERGLVLLAHQTPHRGHGIAAVRGSHAFLRLGRSAQDSRGEARGRKNGTDEPVLQ